MAIDFRLQQFFYPIGIYRLRRTFERTQWLPPEQLRAYQEQHLRQIINHAYQNVPYYRRLFEQHGLKPSDIRSTSDLSRLPLLNKATIRSVGDEIVANDATRYRPVRYRTSGTSGTPIELYRDRNSLILEFVYYWRAWSWAGYRLGDRFAELGSAFFLHRRQLAQTVSHWQPLLRRLMLNSGQISVQNAKKMADAIRRQHPLFLKGMASALYFLALCLKESGITDLSFKAVFSTGEVLTPQYRAMAEAVFGCPVLDSYGTMEGVAAISQCLQGGYHVHSDYGIVEFDGLRDAADDKKLLGRVVGSSLYNMAMPLIRYDLGDDIELFPEPRTCPCSRTLPLVRAIHGRAEDTIITPDGRFITSMFVVPEFSGGVRLVQFIQDSQTSLRVNVVPSEAWNNEKKTTLAYYVRRLVGNEMNVSIHEVSQNDIVTDPSGKIRLVISQVKQSV